MNEQTRISLLKHLAGVMGLKPVSPLNSVNVRKGHYSISKAGECWVAFESGNCVKRWDPLTDANATEPYS